LIIGRTTLNLCNEEVSVGTQHNQYWWPSRMSELCCACRTSSIVTTQNCKKVFEAYARIFVYVNSVTPVTCGDNILINLVFKQTRHSSNKLVW